MRGDCPCARGKMRGKMHGKMRRKMRRKMARMMRRMMRRKKLGAPKLLCARLLARHAKLLDLTADQVTRLGGIHKAHHAAMGKLRLQSKRILAALRAEWLKDSPDAGQIRKLAGELAALLQKKIAAKADYLLKAQGVLTPAQYKKLLTLPPKGHHGMGKPCGKPCGQGGPDNRADPRRGKPCRDCVS